MNRLTLVLLLASVTSLGCDSSFAASQPNVLFIVSEDNGPELGCYGDRYARTPNLDRLAAQGVRFNRAFVPQSGCSQSRASIMTGLYPHQHGQIGLATWGFRMYRDDTLNLPRSLKEAGYRTGIIGKLHVNPESAFPFDMKAIPTGNFARKNLADYAKRAESFIKASDKPFFLSVNYPDAHHPWLDQVDGLPKELLTGKDVKPFPYFGIDTPQLRDANASYYNCMSRMDSLVGDLLAALQRSGKADNTLIIYLGDHGPDFLRGKRTCYEGGLRIPLVVRWPEKGKPQVREELVSTLDLMPTVLAVCGAMPVANLPGHSLLPILTGEKPEWRRYLFAEYHTHAAKQNFYPQRCVRDDRYKLIENLLPDQINPGYEFTLDRLDASQAAIQAAAPEVRGAYLRMQKPPRFELYDLKADAFEFRDLTGSAEHAAIFTDLKKQLASWRDETKDPLLNATSLQRLKLEVDSMGTKAVKNYNWGYPSYFFGKEPPPKKKAKEDP